MRKQLCTLCLLIILAACLAPGAVAETILVISDMHISETDGYADTADALQRAAASADTVILLGDNTNNSHEAEHQAVLALAGSLRAAGADDVLIIPGNHDYKSAFGPSEFRKLYVAYGTRQAFSRDAATASCAVMTAGGTCVLLLDTNSCDDAHKVLPNGGVTADTLSWLEATLASLPASTPVVACGHHPILQRDQRTPGANALAELLRTHGVKIYLCGHDHGFATIADGGLRQITVGQPHAWPGWAGFLETAGDGFSWHTECIYDERSSFYAELYREAENLAERMARGTLAPTAHANDETAIAWFTTAFMHHVSGTLTPDICRALLASPGCAKWREIDTRTIVRDWIISVLEECPESVRSITIPRCVVPATKYRQNPLVGI